MKSIFLYTFTLATLLVSVAVMSGPTIVHAGCGCQKLPPPPASVRPAATYAGTPVTLFHSALVNGQPYTVRFTSGTTGQSLSVVATAMTRRDLGDGQYKPQLVVPVPNLPLGPTSITVRRVGQTGALLAVSDTAFTIAPAPIVVPSQVGDYRYRDYRAAVSREGVVYISLDLSGVTLPRTFRAQPQGYPLRFGSEDVVFYNREGFLMQLLEQNMPGLFAITAANTAMDGDVLQYSRHEFNTFFLQHGERETHAVDPTDPNWHLDGTRHIDHNQLILAIRGMLNGGGQPVPGSTPAFEMVLSTYSLFNHGLVGADEVFLDRTTRTDSYSSTTGVVGAQGDVLSNGPIRLTWQAVVNGDATGSAFSLSGNAKITGTKLLATQPTQFMPVSMPNGLQNLGSIILPKNNAPLTLGPGSYRVSKIDIRDNTLFIDNTAGPVTLYVNGSVMVTGQTGAITVADPDPEKFALYVGGNNVVEISHSGTFYGVVYAPQSSVTIGGQGQFRGAFVGKSMTVNGNARVYYDMALRGQ